MLQRITIAKHERGFLYRDKDYERILRPGTHWIWGFGRTVKPVDTQALCFDDTNLEIYLRDPAIWEDLAVADLNDSQRALVWVDGRLHGVIGPGVTAYWKDLHEVRVEVIDASAPRFAHTLLEAILRIDGGRHLTSVVVPPGHVGMLYLNDVLASELTPGRYAYWHGLSRISHEVLDLRECQLDVSGQEILTADKVSLRLNVVASYRITDAKASTEATGDLFGAIYREIQLALRESVGSRKLDALLTSKDDVGAEIRASVTPRAQALGLTLGAVGIKDVILPGEMKVLLNQVIEAEKRAQANLIARREETAATRSLLNTAKLIESSPTLLRLKELESAERMADSIESIHISSGGLDGLLKQLLPGVTD
jgi:regulator of protease activity HflC (stomatin/prohibitin superfamily)